MQIHISCNERWGFIIPPEFIQAQNNLLGSFGSKNSSLLTSFKQHKKRFKSDPVNANDAHPLKYNLSGFRSSDFCSGNRAHAGARIIYWRISKNVFYLITVIPKHKYDKYKKRADKRFSKEWRKQKRMEYAEEIIDMESKIKSKQATRL